MCGLEITGGQGEGKEVKKMKRWVLGRCWMHASCAFEVHVGKALRQARLTSANPEEY